MNKEAQNENNLIESLNMEGKEVFFREFIPVNSHNRFRWFHARYASAPFFDKGTRWRSSLPTKEAALTLFKDFYGQDYPDRFGDDFWWNATEGDKEAFIERNGGTLDIPYPLMGTYSDIFIVHIDKLYDIARTCGVFSAMNLFVEIAIPTAIFLNVKREKVVTISETSYTSGLYWKENIQKFEEEYTYSLKKLHEGWKDEWLFVHPVKLSKWN